jgi:hypothetical protein
VRLLYDVHVLWKYAICNHDRRRPKTLYSIINDRHGEEGG